MHIKTVCILLFRYAESDSDDFDDDFDDEDNYVPRPTKRRGGKSHESGV